jgi:hypothetical protein
MKKLRFIILLLSVFALGFSVSQISNIYKKDNFYKNNENLKDEVITSEISPLLIPNDTGNNQNITVRTNVLSKNIISNPADNEGIITNIYNNPIDEYFIPRINGSDLCEAEIREYQDTYKGVWKAEFDNIMLWMNNKCVYQEDKHKLNTYKKSVEQLIDATYKIIVTDWQDDYKLPPKSPERNSWGNGTRSALNQIQAEIYRDAGMRLIDKSYSFLKKDYAKEHYE